MENRVKQKKFVSLVLYLHNTQNEVVPFFQKVLPVFRDNFTNFEIVCVNDACTDGTIGVLKEYLEENHCSEMVNIIHMSFFHGLESAMNAGRDLAIGDFIYEFDTAYVDYPSELIMEVYDKLLEGNDIVSAGTRDHVRMTSGFFYFTASGGNFGSDHRDSAYLSGGLYFDPRCSVFKTEPVFTDLHVR